MYKVIIDGQCGCIRRENMELESNFSDRDDALIAASNLAQRMNDNFCGKHQFGVRQEGDNLLVTVNMRG